METARIDANQAGFGGNVCVRSISHSSSFISSLRSLPLVLFLGTDNSKMQTRKSTRRGGGEESYAGRTANEGGHRSSEKVKGREEERISRCVGFGGCFALVLTLQHSSQCFCKNITTREHSTPYAAPFPPSTTCPLSSSRTDSLSTDRTKPFSRNTTSRKRQHRRIATSNRFPPSCKVRILALHSSSMSY